MRALLLLLLLANLLFFAWSAWVAPQASAVRQTPPAPIASRSIRLVSEVGSGETTTAAVPRAAALPAGDCVSVGPYLEAVQAQAATARLQTRGFAARLRETREEVWVGQWVRINNLSSADDVPRALAALRATGLSDAYVITEEYPGNVISLGVYSDAGRAGEVAALARQAGYPPAVGDRFRTAQVFWLDIDRRANGGLPELEDLQGDGPPPGTRLELRACSGATGA